MGKVYLAMACTDYEGSDVIRAFASETNALAFVEACREHARKRPECPSVIEDTPANDAMFERHWKQFERWQKRHPATKEHATADSFEVQPVDLVDATP